MADSRAAMAVNGPDVDRWTPLAAEDGFCVDDVSFKYGKSGVDTARFNVRLGDDGAADGLTFGL